jgi:hypothetical protein
VAELIALGNVKMVGILERGMGYRAAKSLVADTDFSSPVDRSAIQKT